MKKTFYILCICVLVSSCLPSNEKKGENYIHPLVDTNEFTNFVPTIVTNYMIINTNISIMTNYSKLVEEISI